MIYVTLIYKRYFAYTNVEASVMMTFVQNQSKCQESYKIIHKLYVFILYFIRFFYQFKTPMSMFRYKSKMKIYKKIRRKYMQRLHCNKIMIYC